MNNLIVPKKEYEHKQKTMQRCSIEIYEKSADYDTSKVFENIKNYCDEHGAKYVSMFHDKDFFTENTFNSRKELIGVAGEKKSNHFHVLVSFKNQTGINDFALAIGIEDRWIKILKHESDFDNMIVYLTHVKYDETKKAHYSPSLFDSNILDYCMFIYDHAVKDIESSKNNIITFVQNEIINKTKKKIKLNKVLAEVLNAGYELNEYNKYYRVIKDLIAEKNLEFSMVDDNKAIKAHLRMVQDELTKEHNNSEAWAMENMRLRGISVDEKKGKIFD